MKKIIVAIDGYSSCGKSTIAKQLAQYAGYRYIDTGAMYRAVALYALVESRRSNVENLNSEYIVSLLPEVHVDFAIQADGSQHVTLNGEDVEKQIRTLEVGNMASQIAVIPEVRRFLVAQQQKMGEQGGIVMDGRDIGTVVFPNAELKLFLTASPEVRAERRFKELVEKGEQPVMADVLADVNDRDYRDTHRAESPLRQAEDAVVVDNSHMTREEQMECIYRIFDAKIDRCADRVQTQMQVTIDQHSGFCAGVTGAIRRAENELQQTGQLYCLGDIVHNGQEVQRLEQLGLETIDYDDLRTIHNARVLLRAHGEPPSTYWIARQNGNTIIDGTCPVVKRLQERIAVCYNEHKHDQPQPQIVIFGKRGHAEVIGLQGQTNNTAIVLEHADEAEQLDYTRPIYLFSQTTKSVEGFNALVEAIKFKISDLGFQNSRFEYYDTICRSVANRVEQLKQFAREQDLVLFVGGTKSSNAAVLFDHCRDANADCHFLTGPDDLTDDLLAACRQAEKVGICGATSTPLWLMEQVRDRLIQQ